VSQEVSMTVVERSRRSGMTLTISAVIRVP
jgi:hypothetical protein